MLSAFCASQISCSLQVVAGRILMVCLGKTTVLSVMSASVESWSPAGALDRASAVIWFLLTTWMTLALYLMRHSLKHWMQGGILSSCTERDQWLVVGFHSELEAHPSH